MIQNIECIYYTLNVMYYVCMYGEIEGKWQNVKNVKDS